MKQMPIILDWKERAKYTGYPKTVPFSLLNEDWAQNIHGQTLDRLAERGGMSPDEIVMNMSRIKLDFSLPPYVTEKCMNLIKLKVALENKTGHTCIE